MKPLFRNVFLTVGIVALVFLFFSFPDGWATVRQRSTNVFLCLTAAVALWAFIYALNAWAFQMLVNTSDHDKHLSFLQSCRLTLTAYAFNGVTPFGLGGSPYRVMEMGKYIGFPRAISATAVYTMQHIFAGYILWATGCVALLGLRADLMAPWLSWFVGIFAALFVAIAAFFIYSYKHGILSFLFHIFFYIPGLAQRSRRFYAKNYDGFQAADANIRHLYAHPRQLWGSLALEYAGHLLSVLEVYLVLLAFGISGATFVDALLVHCFTSLLAYAQPFISQQPGAREGSLAVIMHTLFGASTGIGIYASIFTRIREIFWVVLGVLLVKVGYKRIMK